MIEQIAYHARCATIIILAAGMTYLALTIVDRLAANWTECGHWTACPSSPVLEAL